MDCKDRILVDIEKLDETFKKINFIKFTAEEEEIVERAKSYQKDCEYYLKKEDEITSFGCITYAHGLLDAIKLNHGID